MVISCSGGSGCGDNGGSGGGGGGGGGSNTALTDNIAFFTSTVSSTQSKTPNRTICPLSSCFEQTHTHTHTHITAYHYHSTHMYVKFTLLILTTKLLNDLMLFCPMRV